MYGINEYLMVMREAEKARLARQARKDRPEAIAFPEREPAVRDGQVAERRGSGPYASASK